MAITLPEKFERYDIVIRTDKKRRWSLAFTKPPTNELFFVKDVDWPSESIRFYKQANFWYSFLDFTIIKKNCPIVKLIT